MTSRYDPEEIKHQQKLKKIQRKGERILRKRELKEAKREYKKPRRKIQTSKVIVFSVIFFIIVNCIVVEFKSFQSMDKWGDLTALSTLISVVIGSCFAIVLETACYMAKSFLETKEQKKNELEEKRFEYNNHSVG